MKKASTLALRIASRTIGALKKTVASKILHPLTDKAFMLEGLCSVLFVKLLYKGAHHLTSKFPEHSTMEPPTQPVQHKIKEEKVPVDSRDIVDQRPP